MFKTGGATKASELFREHTVARYYFATLDLAHPDPTIDPTDVSSGFSPKPSSDTALTAFAQLAALRLNTSRSLISLIDSSHQFVLAEATRAHSPHAGAKRDGSDGLWLGSTVIPRSTAVCDRVLDNVFVPQSGSPDEVNDDVYVIEDLRCDPQLQYRPYVLGDPHLCFYAGAPIRVADGTIIGVYCVFDDVPRPRLSAEERLFLTDMAATVSNYLDTAKSRASHKRSEKLVRGLESFVDGSSELRPARTQPVLRKSSLSSHTSDGLMNVPASSTEIHTNITPSIPNKTSVGADSSQTTPLWEQALPQGSMSMFSRAANIIKQASELDGVVFYEVSSLHESNTSSFRDRSSSRQRRTNIASGTAGSTLEGILPAAENESSSHSGNYEKQTSAEDSDYSKASGNCDVLGCAVDADNASTPLAFAKSDMRRLMGKRPRPRAFTLDRVGQGFTNDTSTTISGTDSGTLSSGEKASSKTIGGNVVSSTLSNSECGFRRRDARISHIAALRKLCPNGRSFICLPLWDFERSRWFAVCICWSTSSARDLALDGDLHYAKIFGNSIMTSLAYLDAKEAKQSKTTFTASISHELRSPLHGILGSADFLNDSSLNRFQQEMVDSIRNCGRTLLDTVESIMDFSKINNFTEKHSLALSSAATTSRLTRPKLLRNQPTSSMTSDVDLGLLTEEVMEAVLIGDTVQSSLLDRISANEMTRRSKRGDTPTMKHRGRVKIALHIGLKEHWNFQTQPGAWRRIVMNLFANSLKYTDDGLVSISLTIDPVAVSAHLADVTLIVKDSGRGMSARYLHDHLFRPFSQEDSFQVGTGLGMSIVKQLTQAMGGEISVESTIGQGTTVEVKIRLIRGSPEIKLLESDEILAEGRRCLQGLKICILHDSASFNDEHMTPKTRVSEQEYLDALVFLLSDWFGVDAFVRSAWIPGSADLIICSEPSFKYLARIRNSSDDGNPPPVLIITYDAVEMAALRADVRITDKVSVVEITSQPYGPRKIARALLECLNRAPQKDIFDIQPESEQFEVEGGLSRHCPSSFRSQEPQPPPTPPTEPVDRVDSPSAISALIVDDNQINRRLLVAYMKRQHIFYQEAENGQEALDLYKARSGAFRYILMDISMPVMDGMASTRKIREFEKEKSLQPSVIIAVTGLASASARVEAHNAGVDHFLTKPIPFSQLGSVLV